MWRVQLLFALQQRKRLFAVHLFGGICIKKLGGNTPVLAWLGHKFGNIVTPVTEKGTQLGRVGLHIWRHFDSVADEGTHEISPSLKPVA
jgi:hypothetical protein